MEEVPDYVSMELDPDDPDPLIDAPKTKQEKTDEETTNTLETTNTVQVKTEPLDITDIEEESKVGLNNARSCFRDN